MLVDIILILVLALFVFIGWKRGMMLTLFSLFSLIIAFFLASLFAPVVSMGIESTGIADSIQTSLSEYVYEALEDNASKGIEDAAESLPLPGFMIDDIVEGTKGNVDNTLKGVSKSIAKSATSVICGMIAFAIVFVLALIALQVLKILLKLATKLPVIKQADKIGGIIAGLLSGIVSVSVFLLIISAFVYFDFPRTVMEMVEDSTLTKLLYDSNILGRFLSLMI